jgi:hypothetical protein
LATIETSSGIQLRCAVEIVVYNGVDLEGNEQLAAFTVTDGPAVFEIESIRTNLLKGEALEQTVAMAKRVDTGELLGFANVRYHEPFPHSVPAWLNGLRSHPYVGVLARDDKYFKCKLNDGETWLGGALIQSVIEIVTPLGEQPETMWAFAWRNNGRSHRAFHGHGFRPHARSGECGQDVLVRWSGEDLRPPPGLDSYIPPPRPTPVATHEVGRNDPCWCGSGTKFKKCHGR